MNIYDKTSVAVDDFEPFLVDDKQAGEVHWLTLENSSGEAMYSGLWRCEPMTFEYEFPGDEIFHVLEGSLLVELHEGDRIQLEKGDIISFKKGLKSTWTIQASFKKFFVISNC